jgi:hypothetical protein
MNDLQILALLFGQMVPFTGKGIDDPHGHQCPKCEHVWEHDPREIGPSKDDHDLAHTCPKCKTFSDGCLEKFYNVIALWKGWGDIYENLVQD